MLSSALIQAQQDDVWLTDYNEAQKIAKEKKLPLFMYFTGSDWCKPCIKLKEDYFETSEFLNKTNDFGNFFIQLSIFIFALFSLPDLNKFKTSSIVC